REHHTLCRRWASLRWFIAWALAVARGQYTVPALLGDRAERFYDRHENVPARGLPQIEADGNWGRLVLRFRDVHSRPASRPQARRSSDRVDRPAVRRRIDVSTHPLDCRLFEGI